MKGRSFRFGGRQTTHESALATRLFQCLYKLDTDALSTLSSTLARPERGSDRLGQGQ